MQNVAVKTNLGYLTQCFHWQCPCRVTRNSYRGDRTKEQSKRILNRGRNANYQCEQLPSRWPGCHRLAGFLTTILVSENCHVYDFLLYKVMQRLCFGLLHFANNKLYNLHCPLRLRAKPQVTNNSTSSPSFDF